MDKDLEGKIAEYLADSKDRFIKELQGLLKFNSVLEHDAPGKPFGAENARALDYTMGLCENTGLKCRNIDYYAMDATFGQGEETVASLSHLDIVPASGGWEHDPLAGEVEGDIIYGRGTIDDKGPTMAALYAVKALIHAGVPLKRKIRLIFGCDEESGMSDMKYYLSKCEAPKYAFSPDASFPCIHAEKDVITGEYNAAVNGNTIVEKIEGGTRRNVVPDCAKAHLTRLGSHHSCPNIRAENKGCIYEITAKGVSAHASTPWEGENAIIVLAKYLSEILPEGDPYKSALGQIYKAFEKSDGSGLGIDCHDRPTGPLTSNLGVISGDRKSVTVTFDVRNPVTLSSEVTHKKLERALSGFELIYYRCSQGLYLEKSHPLIETLQGVYGKITGDKSEPFSIGGGTYARTLPCAVAFGPIFREGKSKGAHVSDECASITELLTSARIYANSLYELSNL